MSQPRGLKWYFALSGASLESREHDWRGLARAAVQSARANTSLRPHLLWDGPEHEFLEEMRARGVVIIRHRVPFYTALEAHNPDPHWLAIAAGAFLRVQIPVIETEAAYVLYTDADVMFMHDFVPALQAVQPHYFAACTEFTFSDGLNSGVMLLNIPQLRAGHAAFTAFIGQNLHLGLDQDMYRAFYAGKWEAMPPEFNWKPYWGPHEPAMIVHWHGIKPVVARRLLNDPAARTHPDLQRLVAKNPQGYLHYLPLHDAASTPLPAPRHNCAAVLMVRDEAADLLVWLAWYKMLGFDTVLAYDDDSTDGTWEILQQAARFYDIRLDRTKGGRDEPWERRQARTYQHALATHKDEFAWLGFFDADEFLWLSGGADVKRFLAGFAQADQVAVNWCNYGSSGHMLRPAQPAPLAYTWHGNAARTVNRHVKCFVRPRAVGPDWIGVHCFDVPAGRTVLASGAPVLWSETPGIIAHEPDWSAARLMHYQCRSMEHFIERLKKRPPLQTIPFLWQSYDLRDEEFRAPLALAARLETDLAQVSGRAPQRAAAAGAANNISRFKPATQSSHCQWSLAPTREQDAAGAVNGALDGTRKFHTDKEETPWWQVDLGGIATITEIHVHNTTDATYDRFRDFALSVSIDGASWVALLEKRDGVAVTAPVIWHGPGTAWARFVRVTLLGHDFLHLDQVEVFGRLP